MGRAASEQTLTDCVDRFELEVRRAAWEIVRAVIAAELAERQAAPLRPGAARPSGELATQRQRHRPRAPRLDQARLAESERSAAPPAPANASRSTRPAKAPTGEAPVLDAAAVPAVSAPEPAHEQVVVPAPTAVVAAPETDPPVRTVPVVPTMSPSTPLPAADRGAAEPVAAGSAVEADPSFEPVAATGTVKWFNSTKGYGFIAGNDGSDVFVHQKEIVARGYRALEPGQRVRYLKQSGPRGLYAASVEAVSG